MDPTPTPEIIQVFVTLETPTSPFEIAAVIVSVVTVAIFAVATGLTYLIQRSRYLHDTAGGIDVSEIMEETVVPLNWVEKRKLGFRIENTGQYEQSLQIGNLSKIHLEMKEAFNGFDLTGPTVGAVEVPTSKSTIDLSPGALLDVTWELTEQGELPEDLDLVIDITMANSGFLYWFLFKPGRDIQKYRLGWRFYEHNGSHHIVAKLRD